MKRILFVLMFLTMANASFVALRIWDQDDLGDIIFEQFTYSLAVDCENAQIYLIVMNATNMPVENATTYLQYLENPDQIISRMTTPKNGTVIHQLPGNTSYMRSRWNLLIEKTGYRSKAVQFDLAPCYSNWTPAENTYVKQTNSSQPSYNEPTNATSNNYSTNTYNNTYNSTNQNYVESTSNTLVEFIPAIFAIGVLLIIFKYAKQTRVHRKDTVNLSSAKLYWRKKKVDK